LVAYKLANDGHDTRCKPIWVETFKTPRAARTDSKPFGGIDFGPYPPSIAKAEHKACAAVGSSTRYGQNRHYLHRFAWEDCKVRVVFEKLRGGLV